MSQPCFTADQVLDRAARLYDVLRAQAPEIALEDLRLMAGRLATLDLDALHQACVKGLRDYPEWMDPTEARIIDAILDVALADPEITVSVYDEAEAVLPPTRDRHEIEKETAQTGMTFYQFVRGKSTIGSVMLVHGNGVDVISDYSDNIETERLLARANKLANGIEG